MTNKRTFHITRRSYGRQTLRDQYLLLQSGANWKRGLAPGYSDTGDTLATEATADTQIRAELEAQLEDAK
jgi:hypothetical protein